VKSEQTAEGVRAEPQPAMAASWKSRALDVAMVIAFGLMIVAVSLQVFFRYVLNDPLAGSEEIGRLAFVWVTFIGAAVATRDRLHVRIDYFANRLSSRGARYCRIVENVAAACFGAVMVWVGILLAIFSWDYESASLQFPMTLVHASVPVSGLLIAAWALRKAWTDIATGEGAK
jgi:TRAP-type C4-dicarboxylate transport system permease small subunit